MACASSLSLKDSAGSREEDVNCGGLVFRETFPDAVPSVDRLGELPNLPPSLVDSREEENGEVMLNPFGKDGNHESGPDHERFLPKKPFCSIAFVLLDL